jgi:hypothetical protein
LQGYCASVFILLGIPTFAQPQEVSDAKHIVGRELLKDKMLKSFERLCDVLGQCH